MAKTMPKKKTAMTAAQFRKLFNEIEATGKTPTQMAEDLGVGRTSMYRWLNGSRKIDSFTAQALRAYHALQTKGK